MGATTSKPVVRTGCEFLNDIPLRGSMRQLITPQPEPQKTEACHKCFTDVSEKFCNCAKGETQEDSMSYSGKLQNENSMHNHYEVSFIDTVVTLCQNCVKTVSKLCHSCVMLKRVPTIDFTVITHR